MFSHRTDWPLQPNRLERARRAHAAAGRDCVDLTETNPTRCGLGIEAGDLQRALARPGVERYEPDPFGPPAARRALADAFELAEHGVGADQLICTASTSESYSILFRLLGDAGDRIVAPAPGYPLFPYLARLDQMEIDPYRLEPEDRFRIDFDALEAAITPRTRAVLVVHPGNPTGTFVGTDEAERLEEICRRHGLALIADEVFGSFAWHDDPGRLPTWAGRDAVLTFTLNGLSKSLALPQGKLAWIALSGPADTVATARARLEVVCDTYLSVNTPILVALPALLKHRNDVRRSILARVQANHAVLEQALGDGAARCLPIDGGWSAIVEVPHLRTDEEWCLQLLEQHDLWVHPGYFFDFPRPGYLIVSLLPPPDRFRTGAERLAAAVRSY